MRKLFSENVFNLKSYRGMSCDHKSFVKIIFDVTINMFGHIMFVLDYGQCSGLTCFIVQLHGDVNLYFKVFGYDFHPKVLLTYLEQRLRFDFCTRMGYSILFTFGSLSYQTFSKKYVVPKGRFSFSKRALYSRSIYIFKV